MPEVCRFLGIVIGMFYNDHAPPHFHAFYGEFEITVRLADGVVEGRFPRRALAHVVEWYTVNKVALQENWERARLKMPLRSIDPLE